MTKIILLDSNSLIYRAFYALPLLQNTKGQFTNAIYGYLSMLQRLITEENPTHICAIFDEGEKTFRNEIYQDYKAHRKPMPDELSAQLPVLRELLNAMQIKILSKAGYEADDIIGTLSKRFKQDTIIVSGDRDCLQLVDNTTRFFYTRRGVTDVVKYDLIALNDEGLSPQQVIEYKGLAGDSSDNIPGAKGVGDKTARTLLDKYGNIENIYRNIEELKGKLKENLIASKDAVALSKVLATINTNVDIPCSIEDIIFRYPLSKSVLQKMQELEFKTISTRFLYTDDEISDISKVDITTERISTEEALYSAVSKIDKGEKVAIHWGEEIILAVNDCQYAISINDSLFGEGLPSYKVAEVLTPLYGSDYTTVFFDTKSEMHALQNVGITPLMPYEDLQLKAYLSNSGRTFNSVQELLEIYLPQNKYLCCAMLQLNKILDDKLLELELETLYKDIELPLVECLYDMERTGFLIDKQVLEELSSTYQKKLDLLIAKIYNLAGEEFNINSPKQLGCILFDKLGLPKKKKTKTGYSVSAEVLENLDHPIAKILLRYRTFAKLKSTYIDGMRNVMDTATNRVHTNFKQSLTLTGRLSSTEPNLQNIPIRRAEGREIRKMFCASQPDGALVTADYSQIELRLLAHFSKDDNLIKAYQDYKDIHSLTASRIYKTDLSEVTDEMRNVAKAVNFGIIYGISSFGLAKNLSVSRSKANKYIEDYFYMHPSVKKYMQDNVAKATTQGYLRTFKGRIRFFPELRSPNHALKLFGRRAAMNMPLQGGASDIIKIAMLKVWRQLKADGYTSKLILQVHDELIIDCPKDEIEPIKLLLKETMESAVQLRVPLIANISSGKNWFEAN